MNENIHDSGAAPAAASGPYPAISPHKPNPRITQLISQDIAYSKGEESAIHQYLYQHWLLRQTHPDLSRLLLRIAEVEMKHLDLLGEMIRALGGDPRFCAAGQNGRQYWNASMIHYGGSLRRMLLWDIEAERDAADLYESQARYVRDENIGAILSRLAQDERLHHRLLQNELDSLPTGASLDRPAPSPKGKKFGESP